MCALLCIHVCAGCIPSALAQKSILPLLSPPRPLFLLSDSLATPLGIAVGIGVRETYNTNAQAALYVEGVFDSISAGILIYVGLVELLTPLMTQSGEPLALLAPIPHTWHAPPGSSCVCGVGGCRVSLISSSQTPQTLSWAVRRVDAEPAVVDAGAGLLLAVCRSWRNGSHRQVGLILRISRPN